MTADPNSINADGDKKTLSAQQRLAIQQIKHLTEQRHAAEIATNEAKESGLAHLKQEHADTLSEIETAHKSGLINAKEKRKKAIHHCESTFKISIKSAEEAHQNRLKSIHQRDLTQSKKSKDNLEFGQWIAESVYEANQQQPREQFLVRKDNIEETAKNISEIARLSSRTLKRYWQPAIKSTDLERVEKSDNPTHALHSSLQEAQRGFAKLRELWIPKCLNPLSLLLVFIVIGAIVFGCGWLVFSDQLSRWIMTSSAVTAGILIVWTFIAYIVTRRQTAEIRDELEKNIRRGLASVTDCIEAAEQAMQQKEFSLQSDRDKEITRVKETYEPRIEGLGEHRQRRQDQAQARHEQRLKHIEEQQKETLPLIESEYNQLVATTTQTHQDDLSKEQREHKQKTAAIHSTYDEAFESLKLQWDTGIAKQWSTLLQINERAKTIFGSDHESRSYQAPTTFPDMIQFGSLDLDFSAIPHAIPTDARLAFPCPQKVALPAILDFPVASSLLIKTTGASRANGINAISATMFRLLTALPPGKVRFTIFDPIGLGQSFAGFMHLADYENAFALDKIWSESRHFEQRLADLTDHMEVVIQKYLRNEFPTIAHYNQQAGPIAEPYRFLVIADFPNQFSEISVRRLASIINSGPRCGVFTLMTMDTAEKLPSGFDLEELERGAVTLIHRDGDLSWQDDTFADLALSTETPPSSEQLTETLHVLGPLAQSANRVEVPFHMVSPDADNLWQESTTDAITVPLGLNGANKMQYLALGKGTSQHVLLTGKTGSGKSTLLHVLITNLALRYSPDEVECYLIDFKKGVEFKTYATHELPHARVIAIESDREFGISVLDRLDSELRRRGALFRDAGVQDLPGFRAAHPEQPMPRSLLIIDEFQELFIEEDKVAQDAALLMDRLVRQGRAFGIHVLLGSQTLGGAYSLARSTIGQMNIRIALQCSEADAHMVLGEDNDAARLLSRPGEAIYNDANGQVEGNSPFQVVWLDDADRDKYLGYVQNRFQAKPPQGDYPPPAIFEGNVPAHLERNQLLATCLQEDKRSPKPTLVNCWLGEAIAIKDPTACALQRETGSHLIIVGQRDESALAMMASSLISVAAQVIPSKASDKLFNIVLLDATNPEDTRHGFLQSVLSHTDHEYNFGNWRQSPEIMDAVSTELSRRQNDSISDAPPVFVFIHALHRFRDLRRGDDDFSFSIDEDTTPTPDKQLKELLREGPVHGMHVITWCDTVNNMERAFDRQSLRELSNRVLFQMSTSDSATLVDSPIAANLGMHRALIYRDELAQTEKFRPYAMPETAILDFVAQKLGKKTDPG